MNKGVIHFHDQGGNSQAAFILQGTPLPPPCKTIPFWKLEWYNKQSMDLNLGGPSSMNLGEFLNISKAPFHYL